MGQIKLMVNIALVTLFVIALTSYAINFATDNDADITISDSNYPAMKNTLEDDVDVFYADANTSVEALTESTISTSIEASEGGTQFKTGPWTLVSQLRTSVKESYKVIFGADSNFNVVFTVFFSLLAFIMGLYIYKTWAGRNPD